MAASLEEIRTWFETAEQNNSSHMIVVCDTYDWEDYPVYVSPQESIVEEMAKYDDVNMQRIMEIYRIDLGWDAQSQGRVRNI
jgi:hypothetical protein